MNWSDTTKYKILLEISNAVINNISRDDFFKALSRELTKHFYYDRLSIFLYDDKNQSLTHFTVADGVQPEGFSDSERSLSAGAVANMVIQTRKPVIIDDLSSYTNHSSVRSMLKVGLKATMAFPLIVGNQTLGTFHVSFKQTPEYLLRLSEMLNDVSKQIAMAVGNMVAYTRLKDEKQNLEREKHFLMDTSEDYRPENFLCTSPAMLEIMKLVDSAADIDAPILLTGETGTGKDYLARYLHSISPRRDHLFVKVNCPALPPSLFESELFGHARGAFTGADFKRVGRFEMADKGIVFLDEIAELPVSLQAKLLQVIQERQFEKVGDNRPVKTNFRLIAATNRDLPERIREGNFRQDLYYRLNIFQIQIPPLRERREDIPLLIDQINRLEAVGMNRAAPQYNKQTMRFLNDYHWPGNIRELKNLVKRNIILRPGKTISLSDILPMVDISTDLNINHNDGGVNTLAESELQCIKKALIRCKGVIGGPKGAAYYLSVPKSTLQYRLKKYRLKPADYKE